MQSYLNKTFVIDDPEARIRQDNDLLSFAMEDGNPKLIPQGTEIRVTDAKALDEPSVFVNAENLGWTAAGNLKNKFLNETLATFEPQDTNQKGANAAWDNGNFLRQLTLIQIVGANKTLKYISSEIAEFYLELINAAEADGVLLALKSGFRTYPKQEFLYNGFINKLPGFNLAAKPGFSNHEDGFAYDFEINGYEGNPLYDWLKANAPGHGFVRTVNKEPWHWEYRPQIAATGVYKTDRVIK
jgi:hypothetical protein